MSEPKKGERWQSVSPRHGVCRVMADPIEGYVMARYKGAMPFLVHVSCWSGLRNETPDVQNAARPFYAKKLKELKAKK